MATLREAVLAGLFFFAATVLLTWPIAAHVADGLADLGDAKLNAWILNWDFHQLFRHPGSLFQANIFYPSPWTLTFSENLLGVAVFGFPLYALGAPALAVYNLLFLLGVFGSGLAAWALARWMTGDAAASLLAGLVYAFLPWRVAQIAHVQFQWGAFLGLLTLFLLRYLEEGKVRDLVLFGVCFAWNALSNIHYALFAGLLVAVVLVWGSLTEGPGRRRRPAVALAVAVAAGLMVLPVFLPYWRASTYYGARRSMTEIAYYSGRPVDFLRAGWANRLYGRLGERWPHPESEFFPGLVPLGLAVLAVLRVRRAEKAFSAAPTMPAKAWRRAAARVCDVLVLAAVAMAALAALRHVTALGPLKIRDPGRILVVAAGLLLVRLVLAFPQRTSSRDLSHFLEQSARPPEIFVCLAILVLGIGVAFGVHTPFYRFLVQSAAFLFSALRVPARGIVLFDLALGVLAAWGLSRATVGARRGWRAFGLAAALVITAFEYRAFPFRVDSVNPSPAPVYRWLASAPVSGAVMEWPFGLPYDAEYVFRSTSHWKRLVNGVSGFYPPPWTALAEALSKKSIEPEAWDRVPRGTEVLLWHEEGPANGELTSRYRAAVVEALTSRRIEPLADFRSDAGVDHAFRLRMWSGR